jgi:hypothetical protein
VSGDRRILAAATVGTMLVATSMHAPAAMAQTCFRGHPAPRCEAFTILEFTGAIRLYGKSGPSDQSDAFFYWSGGLLVNAGSASAVGGAFKLTADSDGHRYGPTFRYRRWLGPGSSLDLAPGLYLGGQDNFVTLRFPSPTMDVALNYGDRIGVAVGLDVLRTREIGTDWQAHMGLRFGTWLAPIATVALGVLLAATW